MTQTVKKGVLDKIVRAPQNQWTNDDNKKKSNLDFCARVACDL